MEKRVLFLITLLSISVLIPLQRSTAEITMKVVGSTTIQTFIDGSDDITFTIEITSEAGDYYTDFGGLEVFSDGEGQVLLPDGSGGSSNKYYKLTANPSDIIINGAGTQKVEITLNRSDITRVDNIDVEVLLLDVGEVATLSNILIDVRGEADMSLDVKGNPIQNLSKISDVTFTLKIRNNEDDDLKVNLTLPTSGAVFDSNSINIDTTKVSLSLSSVTLEPDTSEEVTLTIPGNLFTNPAALSSDSTQGSPQLKFGSYFLKVAATPEEGNVAFAETADLRINVVDPSIDAVVNVILDALEGSTQTTSIDENEDISYSLRITNAGSDYDEIYFTVLGDIGTARVNPKRVAIFPDSDRDITLIIPRSSLLEVGTYNVAVEAVSEIDLALGDTVFTKTVVTSAVSGKPGSTQPSPTDLIPSGPVTHKVILSEFMFEAGVGEAGLPQWIEVYNNSSSAVNLRGWKLHWKSLLPSPLAFTIALGGDFHIPPHQARLIVTALGRHSGGGNLSDDAVYQLPPLHAPELEQEMKISRFQNITGGFSLKLTDSQDTLVDHIGTLIGDKQTWQLPESLIEGVRSSLIRRFDEDVPRAGTERRGWRLAFDAKHLVTGIYYGSPHDLGTPGYRSGKPLPIKLSQFSAKFVQNEVVIFWTTESELNNAGFNIYRSISRTQGFQCINEKLIQGAGTTDERNTYQFIDETAKPGVVYFYRLEDINLSGTRGVSTTYRLQGVIRPAGK